eukprot:Selendium_serpulae@DN5511_c1_g1_i2.p1
MTSMDPRRASPSTKSPCRYTSPPTITLNVGGRKFQTSPDTLRGFKFEGTENFFTTLMSGDWNELQREMIFIDRNPDNFGYILDFLRKGSINLPEGVAARKDIQDEAAFYSMEELVKIIHDDLQRTSRPRAVNLNSRPRSNAQQSFPTASQQSQSSLNNLNRPKAFNESPALPRATGDSISPNAFAKAAPGGSTPAASSDTSPLNFGAAPHELRWVTAAPPLLMPLQPTTAKASQSMTNHPMTMSPHGATSGQGPPQLHIATGTSTRVGAHHSSGQAPLLLPPSAPPPSAHEGRGFDPTRAHRSREDFKRDVVNDDLSPPPNLPTHQTNALLGNSKFELTDDF